MNYETKITIAKACITIADALSSIDDDTFDYEEVIDCLHAGTLLSDEERGELDGSKMLPFLCAPNPLAAAHLFGKPNEKHPIELAVIPSDPFKNLPLVFVLDHVDQGKYPDWVTSQAIEDLKFQAGSHGLGWLHYFDPVTMSYVVKIDHHV